ncbi:RAMP superfamily CRISPR-associated protein [Bosea sp. ANAM02]|uniref:RAMP superfamily CRISPR-associated protein n=1 Tax=Bosea sp. ANAM02 TaxID=2020412 RepID=UPI00140E9CCE|nr:RAMP superfamily CRISPR-associated protein [Bosea sp. ANAM02]BCB22474.1 hypothetical protein OCUBac02_53680 [Bosea sp. ANAM02]
MTKHFDVRFIGTMINRSPLHITPPNTQVKEVPNFSDAKAVEIATLPVYRDGVLRHLPVIPASTIRGKLRNAATRVAMRHLAEKPSREAYVYTSLGGVKGSEDENPFAIADRNQRRHVNPIIGLMGGSQPWDRSSAFISNAIPIDIVEPHFVTSARVDAMRLKSDLVDLLDQNAVPSYLKMREATRDKVEAAKKVTDAKKAFAIEKGSNGNADASALEAAKAEHEKAKGTAGNSLALPIAHRVMPAGVVMDQTITLQRVTAVEAGLFLAALNYLFDEDPFFGGKVSYHYGAVDADWKVSYREERGGKWIDAGSLAGTTFSPTTYDGAVLEEFASAWAEYAASGALDLTPPTHKSAGDDTSTSGTAKKGKKAA